MQIFNCSSKIFKVDGKHCNLLVVASDYQENKHTSSALQKRHSKMFELVKALLLCLCVISGFDGETCIAYSYG